MYGAPFDACGAVRDLVSSSLVSQNTGRRSPGFCFIRSDSSARPGRIGPRPDRTGSTQAPVYRGVRPQATRAQNNRQITRGR